MDPDEIQDWSDRYDEVYTDELRATEERLHEDLLDQQYITRDQLETVVRWKLNGTVVLSESKPHSQSPFGSVVLALESLLQLLVTRFEWLSPF